MLQWTTQRPPPRVASKHICTREEHAFKREQNTIEDVVVRETILVDVGFPFSDDFVFYCDNKYDCYLDILVHKFGLDWSTLVYNGILENKFGLQGILVKTFLILFVCLGEWHSYNFKMFEVFW